MSPVNLLLIDDNSHQHELFKCYATLHDDIDLHHADTIDEALDVLKKHYFDLIMLDNRLFPFRSFKETAPQLRENGHDNALVVLSSDIDHQILGFMEECGVDNFHSKDEISLYNFHDFISKYTNNTPTDEAA